MKRAVAIASALIVAAVLTLVTLTYKAKKREATAENLDQAYSKICKALTDGDADLLNALKSPGFVHYAAKAPPRNREEEDNYFRKVFQKSKFTSCTYKISSSNKNPGQITASVSLDYVSETRPRGKPTRNHLVNSTEDVWSVDADGLHMKSSRDGDIQFLGNN